MPKIEAFEKYSDAYDEWFKKNLDIYDAELEAIRQLLPPPGAEGMEIGVGSGKFAAPLGIKIGVEPSNKCRHVSKKPGSRSLKPGRPLYLANCRKLFWKVLEEALLLLSRA